MQHVRSESAWEQIVALYIKAMNNNNLEYMNKDNGNILLRLPSLEHRRARHNVIENFKITI